MNSSASPRPASSDAPGNPDLRRLVRFVFINRFYWPDEPATAQLLTDLAEALAASGHAVSVVASHPGGKEPASELHRGVAIFRVRGTRLNRFGIFGKLADFVTFYVGSLCVVFVRVRTRDIVVPLTDPPLLGVGVWIVARLRGAKLVHWVQDIYPEIAITLTGQRWLKVLAPLRNLAWRRAEACGVLGTDMARVLEKAGVKTARLALVPNWAPAGLSAPSSAAVDGLRARWDLAGKFVVLYSGNLGRVHDLMPMLDVAEQLLVHPHIVFLFIGAGAQLPTLKTAAESRGLTNIRFHPPRPRADLAVSLALGDLHLVTVLPGCESFVFPSKLYGIAAVGRPALFMGPKECEIAAVIEKNRFGWAFSRAQIAPMTQAIHGLSIAPAECAEMGRAATAFSLVSGGAVDAARRWAALAGSLTHA